MMKQYESEADERAAAERREFLSHAHLEGLVDSAQRLLEDKAVRMGAYPRRTPLPVSERSQAGV